jgi:hypothetical protein
MGNLSTEQFFTVITVGPVLFCLFVSWLFINLRKPRIGTLSGLGIIFILLLVAEGWVYSDCLECKSTASFPADTLCCEWTGPGMLIYAIVGIIDAGVFVWLNLGIAWFYKQFVFKADSSSR